MAKLQRPATLKEFVIQSLLGWRDPDPTLVDHDDESPTALLPRRPESSAPPPAAPRDTLASYVFDLRVVPRVASSPSDFELSDTLPAPPPVVPPRASPLRRRHVMTPAPSLAPARASRVPVATGGAGLARFILLVLLVLAALASAGTQSTGPRAAAVHALPHAR